MSDSPVTEDQIKQALSQVSALGTSVDLVAAELIGEIEIDGGEVTIVLKFGDVERNARHEIEDEVLKTLTALDGVEEVLIEVEVENLPDLPPAKPRESGLSMHSGGAAAAPATPVKPAKTALSGVKNLIAVASGKGGVGKSTVAVNLALALAKKGARVGVCDIDIYGPSVPTLLGVPDARPGVSSNKKLFLPVEAYGLKIISIGFLVDENTPVIWRGPIVSSIVKQFLEDVEWGELDYLVIDMPPGTGDAQLTLSQSAPITAAIIVTTPSELALLDAVKGLQMFRKVDTPVLGIVENMSHFECGNCGHKTSIFNEGGPERVSKKLGVDVLASIPINVAIQRGGDTGKPVVAVSPDAPQSEAFLALANAVIEKIPYEGGGSSNKKKGFLSGLFRR